MKSHKYQKLFIFLTLILLAGMMAMIDEIAYPVVGSAFSE